MPGPALSQPLGDDFSWRLLDAAPDGVLVVSGSGEIVFVNQHCTDLFGFPTGDLLGRRVEDLLPEELRSAHRAHRTRYRAAPTVRGMGTDLMLRARRADGSEFPVEISLSPLTIGDDLFTVAAVRDITDRVEAQDYLRRVLHTLDASDEGVFIFDATTLRYSYVNDGAVRLTCYSRDELLTMTPLHLNPNGTEKQYRELVHQLEANPDRAVARQARLLRKDGHEVAVEKTFQSAPPGHDGTRWIVTLARDVTARLEAEEELRRSQDALREAEHVMVLAEDRERIARDLHDTVIQRLFGAGLNLQAAMAVADERMRGRIESTIQDLDETIKELRMAIFSLQGSGAAAPGGLRGRLLAVVTESGDSLGFEPRLQFDGAIETMDEQIAANLVPTLREALANVARHAQARNVRVAISVGDVVSLTVTDDGVGVPDEVIGGRGLSNMADRASTMGGTMELTNQPSGGSRLLWSVPAQEQPEETAADRRARRASAPVDAS
jgi:PAS domain S-box-containing protein